MQRETNMSQILHGISHFTSKVNFGGKFSLLLLGHFMAGKLPKNGGYIGLLAIKWSKSKIFKITTSNM